MLFDDFRAMLTAPALQAVAAHWHEARGARLMPSWAQLRPSRIAASLPIIWTFKYDRAKGDFIGRLAGERITQGFGRSFRGLRLDALHGPETFATAHARMARVVDEPALYHSHGLMFRQRERSGNGERIMLPLASDGVTPDGLLGASVVDYVFADPNYGPIELFSENETWFALRPRAAAA